MRRALLLFTTVIALSLAACAQDTPGWELFGGFQYTRPNIDGGINMNGFDISVQQNSASWWGGIVDVGGSYQLNTNGGVLPYFYTFAAGPQFAYRKSERLQPFTRVMFGGARSNVQPGLIVGPASNASSTAFAMLGGGGIDYVWKDFLAFRATGDYIRSYLFESTQNNFRVSVGVNFRFGRN